MTASGCENSAWLRVAFAAVLNLATANRLVTRASDLTPLGQAQVHAQVFVAVGAFRSQFTFSLILFGAYLVLLGVALLAVDAPPAVARNRPRPRRAWMDPADHRPASRTLA
jgi:hypothetical protein